MSMQDGIRAVQHAFAHAHNVRWPMYVRQARQFLRTAIEGFDERRVRLCLGGRSAARRGQGERAPNRARPAGRRARVPGAEPAVAAARRGHRGAAGGRGRRRVRAWQRDEARPVTEVVADLPIVEAQVDAIPELDGERQPFTGPAVVLGDDEDEGPQPGNELTPGAPTGGRPRRPAARAERAPRAPRAAKSATAKPRTPPAARAPRARKAARPRGGDE